MKKCVKCQTEKNEDCFAKRGNRRRGVCKDCWNTASRISYKDRMGGSTKREQRASSRESDPKVCIKCNQSKPLDDFNWHNRGKGQHRNFCKDCQNSWTRKHNQTPGAKDVRSKWNENNAEKIQEYKDLYKELDANDVDRAAKKKSYYRAYWLKQYGLTIDGYDKMLKDQDGKCKICGTIKPGGKMKNFAVDHCHTTGKVRGLLCFSCNVSIGHFADDSDNLQKAIDYLNP